MFQVTVSVYSSYTCHSYVVSGYMYPTTNQWHAPKCVYTGTGTPDIKVGRDANGKAYISIANAAYTGVRVHNMTRGYQTSVADTYDPWTITIDGATENSVTPTVSKVWHSTNDGTGSGLDADTVDGVHASSFVRRDGQDAGSVTIRVNDADFIVQDTSDSTTNYIWRHHTNQYLYLGTANAQPRTRYDLYTDVGSNKYWHAGNDGTGSGLDADTVDSIQASSFLRSDADDSFSGGLVSTSRDEGIFGTYDSTKTDHIWSMGTGYKNHASGTNFGNLYGLAYKHTNNTTGGTMGGSHQVVWCHNGTPRGAIGYDYVWHTSGMRVGSNTVWHAGNDGTGSGLDADTLDSHDSGSFLRSNVTDNYTSGTLSFNSGTVLKMLSGSDFDTSSGDVYANMRVIRNHGTANLDGMYIGYGNDNSGFTRLFGGGATSGGLYIRGSGANDLTYGNNTGVIWHSANDGAGSGLDADLLDGHHHTDLMMATSARQWSGLNASGTQAKRYHIMRLYVCPAHWDSNHQNIKLFLHEESYESSYTEYHLWSDYNGGNQSTAVKLHVKDVGGNDHTRHRVVVGSPVDAGWDHSNQNVYYYDIYVEVAFYKQVRAYAHMRGHGYVTSNPTSGGATTVVYSSPTGSNISDFSQNKQIYLQEDLSVNGSVEAGALSSHGSAAAPTYSFNVDSDSGMFSLANNAIGFATNGTQRLKINNNGLLITGTSGLHVNGSEIIDSNRRIKNITEGSESAPGLYFGSDSDTGLYAGSVSDVNALYVTSNGSQQQKWQNGVTKMYARVSLESTGNATANTPSMTSRQSSDGNGSTRYHINFTKLNGTTVLGRITTNNYATTYTETSDYRLKENVNYTWTATDRLKQLRPCQYNWISDPDDTTVDGFLAHEVADVAPQAVVGEKDAVDSEGNIDAQGLDNSKLVPLLVKTIQELEARIVALENS